MKINILACGAGGMLLISKIKDDLRANLPYSDITVYGFDGSRSAVGKQCDRFFIPSNLDKGEIHGSAGERATNYHIFKEFVKREFNGPLKELTSFEDGTVNIVISSLGGGSGSMIASNILPIMMGNDVPTFYIGIEDSRTEQLANNTVKQLMTLRNLPVIIKKPLSAFFISNDKGEDPANIEATRIISLLGFLGNKDNVNIDVNDIAYLGALGRYTSATFSNDVYLFNIGTFSNIENVALKSADVVRVLVDRPYEVTNAKKTGKAGIRGESLKEVFESNHIDSIYLEATPGIEAILRKREKEAEKAKANIKQANDITGDADDMGIVL